jgi:heme-degrading monooxygenase HmoA
MIARIWHGWTTLENAPRYEAVVRAEVIPGIEARAIPGFRSIELMRRAVNDEVEFATIMWFDDLASVKGFMGDDYDLAHVPPAAQAMPVPVRPAVVPL